MARLKGTRQCVPQPRESGAKMIARVLNVHQLPICRQVDAWIKGVKTLFPGVDFGRQPCAPLSGAAQGFQIGPAQLWRIISPSQVINIHHGEIDGIGNTVSVVLQLRGSPWLRTTGATQRIAPGTLFFADARKPFEVEFQEECAQLLLHVPRRLVLDRHAPLRAMTNGIDQQDPGVTLLKAALLTTAKLAPRLSIPQASIALASLLQLISAPQALQDRGNRRSWRTSRVLADIECAFRDPDIDAERLARNQQISRRRLDAIVIEETGKTLTAHIWERRLLQAAEDLLDDCKSHEQISEIAFSLGFGQAAHFCRAFKKRFRATPSEWREHRPRGQCRL